MGDSTDASIDVLRRNCVPASKTYNGLALFGRRDDPWFFSCRKNSELICILTNGCVAIATRLVLVLKEPPKKKDLEIALQVLEFFGSDGRMRMQNARSLFQYGHFEYAHWHVH